MKKLSDQEMTELLEEKWQIKIYLATKLNEPQTDLLGMQIQKFLQKSNIQTSHIVISNRD